MRSIIAAALAVLLFSSTASAAPGLPDWTEWAYQQDRWVEQQSDAVFLVEPGGYWPALCPEECVENTLPDHCSWDVDDHQDYSVSGTLPAGATTNKAVCLVADGAYNWGHREVVQALVRADRADLDVRLMNTLGEVYVPERVAVDSKTSSWLVCLSIKRESPVGGYPEIEGTNGGWGIPIYWTLAVTGGERQARNFTAILKVGRRGIFNVGC